MEREIKDPEIWTITTPTGDNYFSMTIYDYQKAIQFLQQGNLPPGTQAAVLKKAGDNWLYNLMASLAKALTEAKDLLFKDGLYRKPGLFGFLRLGKIALVLILDIIKTLKYV